MCGKLYFNSIQFVKYKYNTTVVGEGTWSLKIDLSIYRVLDFNYRNVVMMHFDIML